MRVHAGIDVAKVGIGNMMIFVAHVDASVFGGEHLHSRSKLGGEVKLSGTEHLPVEIQKTSAGIDKGLNPSILQEIYLYAHRTSTGTVGIHPLAIRLGIAHHRERHDFGNIA